MPGLWRASRQEQLPLSAVGRSVGWWEAWKGKKNPARWGLVLWGLVCGARLRGPFAGQNAYSCLLYRYRGIESCFDMTRAVASMEPRVTYSTCRKRTRSHRGVGGNVCLRTGSPWHWVAYFSGFRGSVTAMANSARGGHHGGFSGFLIREHEGVVAKQHPTLTRSRACGVK
jgi:hypothetical protein